MNAEQVLTKPRRWSHGGAGVRQWSKVTFSLPDEVRDELRELCTAKGVSLSAAVLLGLEHGGLAYLRKMAPRRTNKSAA